MDIQSRLNRLTKIPAITYVNILIALFAVGGSFYLFISLAEDVLEQEKFIVDQLGADFITSIQSPGLSKAMGWITELGSVTWLVIASLALSAIILYFYKQRIWRFVYFAIAMIGISLLTKVLKVTFSRKRPDILEQFDGTGFSFPSGHSTGPMVFYGFVIYLVSTSELSRGLKYVINGLLALLIITIGFSRIYLGVHYVTDVVAGFSLGLFWLVVCILVLEYTLRRKP
ncbi:phosphatase PAP2 family protein [Bacillus tianshenii]|nr:phosphatase PAP2 family protein [Bacillus tianshenii]